MKQIHMIQKNLSFGLDDDAWIDVLPHVSRVTAQVHMANIKEEHANVQFDQIMIGSRGTPCEGVMVAIAEDGSQVAYRIQKQHDFTA